jgi:hypothetical protein
LGESEVVVEVGSGQAEVEVEVEVVVGSHRGGSAHVGQALEIEKSSPPGLKKKKVVSSTISKN